MKLNICLFLIKNDELLEKFNEIWEKVKNSIQKEFDSEPLCNEKYLKVKIKTYNGKINTNFHNCKIPEEGSQCICLSVILIDSVFRTSNNYYLQVFLEECKHRKKDEKEKRKRKRMAGYITEKQKFLLVLIDKILMEKILMNKILMKKILIKKIKY